MVDCDHAVCGVRRFDHLFANASKEEVVNAAIVTETAMDPTVQSELRQPLRPGRSTKGIKKEELRISLVSYAEPAAVQAFTTALPPVRQMVIFPASDAQLWQERFGSQELPQETIQWEKTNLSYKSRIKKNKQRFC